MEFPIVGYLLLFTVIVTGFIILNLFVGQLIRPKRPHEEKETIYECGEPTVGSAWVQFDVRYYVIALLFVIFDVEVAFFFPWAVVFGQSAQVAHEEKVPTTLAEADQFEKKVQNVDPGYKMDRDVREAVKSKNANVVNAHINQVKKGAQSFAWFAFFDILVFFGVLLVGFAYLWKRGDLAWVRTVTSSEAETRAPPPQSAQEEALASVGS